MSEVSTLAAGLSTYGIYTIIAVLIFAIMYLFKAVKALHVEMQQILLESVKEQAVLTAKCTQALEANTRAFEKLETIITQRTV